MASAVDSLGRRGWSVSADHRLVRYEFDLVSWYLLFFTSLPPHFWNLEVHHD